MDTRFRFSVDIPLRLRDLDAMNHVNNAVYATFLEQARAAYFHAVVGRRLNEVGMVIADLSIEFERAVRFDDDAVTVGVCATDLGESSIPLEYEVWTDREVATPAASAEGAAGPENEHLERDRVATATTTLVHVDRESGVPKELPDAWRNAFTAYEQRR
jgi:acyl-CoA thioester hydrolase